MKEVRPRWVANYDDVAESFAHFTGLVTAPLAAAMVRLAGLSPTDRILDVGTGTGIVALSAAGQISPPGMVTGIDLAAGQLAVAKRKIEEAALSDRIGLMLGDAENLPFEDAKFDVVLSLFALFHFPHPEKALSEIMRVLKPGGRMVIGVGAGPAWTSLKGWRHRLRRIPDLIRLQRGTLLLGPAQIERLVSQHLASSHLTEVAGLTKDYWFRGSKTEALVRQAGFANIQVGWEGCDLVLDDAVQFWDLQSTFSSLARTRLSAADPRQLESIQNRFLAECREVQGRGGTLEYHSGALFVSGGRALNPG